MAVLANRGVSVLTFVANKPRRLLTLSANVLTLFANGSPTESCAHIICQRPYGPVMLREWIGRILLGHNSDMICLRAEQSVPVS